MHYAIITYGTRGDVQPFVALALGLMDKGHRVTLLAPQNFNEFITGYGVTHYPLHGNAEEILRSPEGVRMLKTGNTVSLMRYMQKGGRAIQPLVNRDILAGCADADLLIASVLAVIWVRTVAEKLNKRWGVVNLNPPSTPTRAFPFAGLAYFNSPGYNLFTYKLLANLYWVLHQKDLNKFRASLGLPALNRSVVKQQEDILQLYAFSPQLISRPTDWPGNTRITGFLTLPALKREGHRMDRVPDGLMQWLQNGDKPVYIGFGSMPVPNPQLLSHILNDLLTTTSHRIVFCKGWSIIPHLPVHASLFVVDHINHEWLLPQCKAAVIHGGAGTTAAVLKAGIPVIIASVFGDQPWWGNIISHKQLGFHIPFKKLTAAKLLNAIDSSQSAYMISSVIKTAEQMNKENGVKAAVNAMEEYFAKSAI